MRAAARMIIIAAMLMSVSGMARGADIRVLGIDAVQDVVRALAEEFGKETGQQVELTFDSAQGLQERIKGGAIFDALIASEASMDAFDSDGIGTDASYEGALMSEGSVPQAARAFIHFLASEDARPHWLAAKLDPVGER
jgi:ABC-type molybdate transport system substrate-binding protein